MPGSIGPFSHGTRAVTRIKHLNCAGYVLLTLLALAPRAPGANPSENKGRRGTYLCQTSNPTYKYYACVPGSYSHENPAGLHLFFHGQGVPGGPGFGAWKKHFLEPFNLIGINMHYTDGDNAKDTTGKVAAAIEAIQQTIADYKVIRGRGVVCSFSGGGLPHAMLVSKYAKRGTKRGAWPFNHSAAYGSNYRESVRGLVRMSWFLGLGSKEWNLAGAGLGRSQTSRAEELFREAANGGCPDIYLKITKDKGHSISEADRADSAKAFRRSDLAFCAFLYERDFPETELKSIVERANHLELGRPASALKALLANQKLDPDLRKKAERIKEQLDERVDAVIELAKQLAQDDPLLCGYYGRIFTQQLRRHPRAEELKKIIAPAKKREKSAASALSLFAKHLKDFFTSSGTLEPQSVPALKRVQTRAGESSLLGKMAGEFLTLQ